MLGSTHRVTDKRIQNLQDIIGHGTLYGNDTIINQLNKLNELVKQNNQYDAKIDQTVQDLSQKKDEQQENLQKIAEQIEEIKQQLSQTKVEEVQKNEIVQQNFKDHSEIIGSGKFQTNSKNITDAINELLGLINQSLNNQLSDEMFTQESFQDRYTLFKQQMQLQILNCGNVMTILHSVQDNIREKSIGEKHIRFGIQDKSMFIEEMQLKDNTIPDIRFEWKLYHEENPAGFSVVYDHSPQIIKSYTSKLLKELQGDNIVVGSANNEKCLSEVDISERLELKNINFNRVKFNCAFEFHDCKFYDCEFQLKFNKKISQFWNCQINSSNIIIPKFAEAKTEDVQLEFQKSTVVNSKVQSYYLFFINEEQLTPEELSGIKVESNDFTIIRQSEEPFSWQLSCITPQNFIDCDFIMIDPIQTSTCEIYIDAKNIHAINCSFQVKSASEEFSKNGLITVERGEINRCKLSAESMKFYVDEGLIIKDSLLMSKNQYTVEGDVDKLVLENNIQML